MTEQFQKAHTRVNVAEDDVAVGQMAASFLAERLREESRTRGRNIVIWLMAAPSGFRFYEGLVNLAAGDEELRGILKRATYFQFDDYPIARGGGAFEATFRHLLEKRLFEPLEAVVGAGLNARFLELTGHEQHDIAVANGYSESVLAALNDPDTAVFEVKGTGMDGHWGFHGAETPLDAPAGMMNVEMGGQNIRQQMLDWPNLFESPSAVPSKAWTFNVGAFLKADTVIDITPQSTKKFAVLACYAGDDPIAEIPSSAIKTHEDSHAFVTETAAAPLLHLRSMRKRNPSATLEESDVGDLDSIWDDPNDREQAENNRAAMWRVLRQLRVVA